MSGTPAMQIHRHFKYNLVHRYFVTLNLVHRYFHYPKFGALTLYYPKLCASILRASILYYHKLGASVLHYLVHRYFITLNCRRKLRYIVNNRNLLHQIKQFETFVSVVLIGRKFAEEVFLHAWSSYAASMLKYIYCT